MYAPVIKKLVNRKDVFIERFLPEKGSLRVSVGDKVKPFDRLGECKYSDKQLNLPERFKPLKGMSKDNLYYKGNVIGKERSKELKAPFDGRLIQNVHEGYVFQEVKEHFVLLSGVWGEVSALEEKKSVLIKTQMKDLHLSVCTPVSSSGELVVFPNPSEVLEKAFLEKFAKSNEGKILYIGHHADLELIKRAYEMGAAAIITGSADRQALAFAKSRNLGLGVVSGFGNFDTPEPIFKLLNLISHRYVFFQGERNTLRIPVEKLEVEDKGFKPIRKVKKGVEVQIFQNPYFGRIGVVDRVLEFSIFVEFGNEGKPVQIKYPNFFIVE